ncbi:HEAT repeat domain-containing protein [Holophaga foetida]|uniref:HEAT repeat domain-containing protein n=1 Tax=Holophaga foetida TaxID=35839 RepID=UPI00024749B7|nr:HEAT repeat domain-containing protein [Holophaga foetida]
MTPFQDFIVAFQRSIKASQMYGPHHPRNLEFMRALEAAYAEFLRGRAQVQLAARNGRMFVDKVPEDAGNLQIGAMAKGFEERSVHALMLYPGATVEELQALLQVLGQKPGDLREAGGAKRVLEDRGVTHIRILATRLEEVTEAGEVAAALLESVADLTSARHFGEMPTGEEAQRATWAFGRGGGAPEGSDPGMPRPVPMRSTMAAAQTGRPIPTLVEQMQSFLLALAGVGQGPADLSGLGDFMERQGLDRQGAQPTTQGVLNQAVTGLPSGPRLGVLLGAAGMRSGPLRNTLGRLAGTQGVSTLAQAYLKGSLTLEELGSHSDKLRTMSPSPERWGDQLAQALQQGGVSEEQLKDLLEVLTWDSQPPETKLAKLLKDQRVFEIPTEKVLTFLRELLEGGKITEFLRLLRHYGSGLTAPALARRKMVAEAFVTITDWVDIPGMPLGAVQELELLMAQAWSREKDPVVHTLTSKAVEHLLWHWVQQGDPHRMATLLGELQDVSTELSPPASWKSEATRDLLSRLGSPERVGAILDRIPGIDRRDVADQVLPYLQMLGATGVNLLVERLAQEPDRTRRSRFLETLKACGSVSEAPLLESLHSPDWFVVRNALIVLAEVAGPDRIPDIQACLTHEDARVRRAAVRAIGRLGGRSAENAILPLLFQNEPETQIEVLFTLAELNSKNAVPGLLHFLRTFKAKGNPSQEKVREKTIEVLGILRSPSVIHVLEGLLSRHRRFFMESKEPLNIRLAALRALLIQESPEAQAIVSRILDTEPKGPEQQALQKALTEFLGAVRPSPAGEAPSQ